MNQETPKPMRRVRRDIFHRVGKSLGMLEHGFSQSSFHQSQDSLSSFNGSSRNVHSNPFEEDDVSFQSSHASSTESPTVTVNHRRAPRVHEETPTISWRDVHDVGEPPMRHLGLSHDQQMQMICQEIMDDKPNRLYTCRDFDMKSSLLRIAVSFNTPKITVPVILFLENTLSRSLFYELLSQHPSAVKSYINLAKLRLDDEHYVAMLEYFGKNENVAMTRIRQANETTSITSKIALLGQAAMQLQSHSWWYSQVLEYQHLLRKQQELQQYLTSVQRGVQLENQTLLRTYKIVFDIGFRQQKSRRTADGTLAKRIKEIETEFSMSPEMIMCGHLAVIIKCPFRMYYEDFLQYGTQQSIFGKKYIIAPEHLAEMVYKWVISSGEGEEKASEKAGEFLQLIQDPTRKLYYAQKFRNYYIAMDTIANNLRDRTQLETLRRQMPPDHPALIRATWLLENTKWKN